MFGLGAINGFYSVPYTILIYPLAFIILPRFWTICRQRGYVTAADFVKDRFGSRTLALVVAFTGILATMPYIALQMFGIQVSLAVLGIPTTVPIFGQNVDLPLIIAFIILAAYTYTSGLRAPAMIAMVKDIMIFIILLVILAYVPFKLGGFGAIFGAAHQKALATPTFFDLVPSKFSAAYATLALGSALALFLYPHSLTGVLSSKSAQVVKRNMALLPIYSLILGFLAMLGFMAIAAHVKLLPQYGANSAVPQMINALFPAWFAGFAFAGIAISALVPAAVMSIAAANLFTRNIYKEYINRNATERQESQAAKITSLVVKFGALLFIVSIPTQTVINFQLLGGVWIAQTLPAVFLDLYTRWFNCWALIVGWVAAMVFGTWMFIATGLKSSLYALSLGPLHLPAMYEAILALVLNLVLVVVLTPIFDAIGLKGKQSLEEKEDSTASAVVG